MHLALPIAVPSSWSVRVVVPEVDQRPRCTMVKIGVEEPGTLGTILTVDPNLPAARLNCEICWNFNNWRQRERWLPDRNWRDADQVCNFAVDIGNRGVRGNVKLKAWQRRIADDDFALGRKLD